MSGAREGGRRGESPRTWLLVTCVVTVGYALVPLLSSTRFFMRGDTDAQFSPIWWHLGDLVSQGNWPPALDPDAWAGGNYAAEALFGVYSPLNVLIWLYVHISPNLLVAVTTVKIATLVALAVGTHLLARHYGAKPWAATVVATAIPFSGFTLYWDAGSWPSGLMAFAYLPWILLTFRRAMLGEGSVLAAFIVGALAVTHGNPYGTLGVVIVGLGLLAEALVQRNRAGLRRLLLAGVATACLLPLVYLPLLGASDLSYRADGALFANNGKLRPELGDLFGLSSPTFLPGIRAIIGEMQVPAAYFAWFVLPLLPWLRYGVLAPRARDFTGLGFVGACYLLLTLGPGKLWLFRWPLRLVEYFYLVLGVVFAVLLSAGLARDRVRLRATGSLGLVALTCFLTWAQHPERLRAAVLGAGVLVLLTAGILLLMRRGLREVALAVLLVGGTGGVLAAQVAAFGENSSSRPWAFPHDVSQLQQRFGAYDGRVMQFASFPRRQPDDGQKLARNWDVFLAGSMYQVADVDAVNNYTGMGHVRFSHRLCLSYEGYTGKCGYRNVWKPAQKGEPALVDLMKLDTLVVQPKLAARVTPNRGWSTDVAGKAQIIRRDGDTPWPESRLSWSSQDDRVDAARSQGDTDEVVEVSSGSDETRLIFAMLDWPGYSATLDGEEIPLVEHPAGFVMLDLPAEAEGTLRVHYRTPGQNVGMIGAGAGLLIAGGATLLRARQRRRPDPAGQPAASETKDSP